MHCPHAGVNGTGNVSYKTALTAIFIEGWIFIILSITGVQGPKLASACIYLQSRSSVPI